MISRRTFGLGAVMCGAAFAAHGLRPRNLLADSLGPINLATAIPTQLGHWIEDKQATVALVNPQTQELLDSLYSEILTRTYQNQRGHRVMLSIAYGKNQADDKAVHYPDVCYPAQGFSISPKTLSDISVGDRNVSAYRLIAKLGGRVEPITYWAVVGNRVVHGAAQHKLAQLQYGFAGIIPDGMIFRVSSIGREASAEFDLQGDFLQSLYANIPTTTALRIFGA